MAPIAPLPLSLAPEDVGQRVAAFQSTLSAIVIQADDGRIIDCNPEAERLLGLTRAQMLGRDSMDPRWDALSADGRSMPGRDHPAMRALQSGKAQIGVTQGIRLPDGRLRWLLVSSDVFVDPPTRKRFAVSSFMDVSERLRLEAWQGLTLSLFDGIAERRPLRDLLASIVESVQTQMARSRCSIHVLSEDRQRLAFGVGPSLPVDYLAALEGLPISPTAGSCGAAAAKGCTVIVSDVFVHPNWAPYLEFPRAHGFRACWSQPVFDAAGAVLGTFAVYYDEVREPDAEDLDLLRRASSLAGLVLQQHQAREDLLLSAALFEQGTEAVAVTRADHGIERINRSFERLTGYALDEVRGLDPLSLSASAEGLAPIDGIREVLSRQGAWQGEMILRGRDGALLPTWISIFAVAGPDGGTSHYVYSAIDISEAKAQAERIRQLAFYDSLTGLPNRALVMDRLGQALVGSQRSRRPHAVLFIDLNRFKEINDTQGHATGDAVLVAVAQRFRNVVRSGDTLARLGGDEFLLLAEGAGEAEVALLGERLAESLHEPVQVRDQVFAIGASIGVALFPGDGDDAETLLKHADIAMYRAKADGGGVRFYRPDMSEGLGERVSLARDLRTALRQPGQLWLAFQPQVDLIDGRLSGAEVLLRWNHPTRGAIPPGDFIPLAEERGMMVEIGEWVMDAACRHMAEWRSKGWVLPGRLAINCAAQQLESASGVARTLALVEAHGLAASLFELDLTEGSLMRHVEQALKVMSGLRDAGFHLAIDDFGIGYSSLSYLKRLPVHRLKIDMSFVRDMLEDRNDHAIVASIIGMSGPLGLDTVAEGVETDAHARVLAALGCRHAQGWHFGRPLDAEAFAARWFAA